MKAFLARWASTTFAVFVASGIVPGITAANLESLIWAGLLLGVLNAVVRPVLLVLSLPLIVLSFGLVILLINAMLLSFVGGGLISGFHVAGFGSAVLGAIVISVASWAVNNALQSRTRVNVHVGSFPAERPAIPGEMKIAKGRVIDDESEPK